MAKPKENDTVVKVSSLSKTFVLPHEKQNSLKGAAMNLFSSKTYETQQALENVSFVIKKGDFVGIVGKNGSGKSTLLKLMAGIYTPTKGSVSVKGSLIPFIELGVGFNPELSGRENVFLNGALLGFTRKQMREMYDEIVVFAELESFMDQKLKNYSSGMQVRLAFSIAIRAKGEVLLLDEVLAVGDANFQRKCFNYFKELKRQGATVVLVTHDMGAVKEFCDRAILIEGGKISLDATTDAVTQRYNRVNFSDAIKSQKSKKTTKTNENSKARIIKAVMLNNDNIEAGYFAPNEKVKIVFTVDILEKIDGLVFGYTVANLDGVAIHASSTFDHDIDLKNIVEGTYTIEAEFENQIDNGSYNLQAAIKSQDRRVVYDMQTDLLQIEIAGWDLARAAVHIPNKLIVKKSK